MTPTASTRPYVRHEHTGDAIWFLGSLVTPKATGADTRGKVTVVEFVNPPGFAPPLHHHLEEDEMFYVLSGTAEFHCDGEVFHAGPGDFVLLPVGLAHTFIVGSDEPLRSPARRGSRTSRRRWVCRPASTGCRIRRRSIPPRSGTPPRSTRSSCSGRHLSGDVTGQTRSRGRWAQPGRP